MKNPFSNSQSAANYATAQAGQSSLLASQQGFHMAKAAQQAANQIGNMAGSYQLPDAFYENMKLELLENTIKANAKKDRLDLMLALLHADDDELFRFKMFFG